MSFKISIKGDRDLVKLLNKAPAIFIEAADKACAEAASRIATNAKIICPYKTGRLMKSIYYQRVGGSRGGLTVPAYNVGADTPYARFVEFGTRFMTPRWFMRNAFLQVQPDINGIMRKQILAYWRSEAH